MILRNVPTRETRTRFKHLGTESVPPTPLSIYNKALSVFWIFFRINENVFQVSFTAQLFRSYYKLLLFVIINAKVVLIMPRRSGVRANSITRRAFSVATFTARRQPRDSRVSGGPCLLTIVNYDIIVVVTRTLRALTC